MMGHTGNIPITNDTSVLPMDEVKKEEPAGNVY